MDCLCFASAPRLNPRCIFLGALGQHAEQADGLEVVAKNVVAAAVEIERFHSNYSWWVLPCCDAVTLDFGRCANAVADLPEAVEEICDLE